MNQSLKKALTVSVSAMTAMWSVGVAAFAPLAAAAAPSAAAVTTGSLVKASLPSVYYVGANGKRYVFPNEKTYKTWWSDFGSVQTITDAQLYTLGIGGNVTYRPGARLVKITTDPKVYMVGAGGALHPIADESTALNLFGANWAQKIDDVPDAFFTNYTVASQTISAALGIGALPVGTIVSYNGSIYIVGTSMNSRVTGDVSIYSAIVTPSSDSEFSAWMGQSASTITNTVASSSLTSWYTPDRMGGDEGGSSSTNPPQGTGSLSLSVTKLATNLAMSAGVNGPMNLGITNLTLCSTGSSTINEIRVDSAAGTISFLNIMGYFQFGDSLYTLQGTENQDAVGIFTAADSQATITGCVNGTFKAATNNTSGVLSLKMKSITDNANNVSTNSSVLMNRNAVAINSSDLTGITFSNPVAPANLNSDGSLQQIFSVQANVSNHDMQIANVVFRLNGSLQSSHLELRIAGTPVSSDYIWVGGKYIVFAIPPTAALQLQATKTWELWGNIDGEAGQTVTPQLVWPAPYFGFYDNVRTLAATAPNPPITTQEEVAPSISRIALSWSGGSTTIQGSSATFEVVPINNVTDVSGVKLNDQQTAGSTNSIIAVYKVKIRGSKATISSLTEVMNGTNAAKGMNNCQIQMGQANDHSDIVTSAVSLSNFSLSNFGSRNNVANANVVVSSTKQLQVGDWLIVVKCDIVGSTSALSNNDTMDLRLVTGGSNASFDQGSSQNFPSSNTDATTITVKSLTQLTVASDNTVRYLVGNSSNTVISVFTITGQSQEAVNVTSIGLAFAAGISGTTGCTTVNVQDVNGTDLSTSQSLTSATTLTFSVTFQIPANSEYKVRVVCVQASSNPTPGTVTGAVTLASIAGTGVSSSQSFNNTPNIGGASVTIANSGTVTINAGTNQPNQIIGNDEQLKVVTLTAAASVNEPLYLHSFTLTVNKPVTSATFSANEVASYVVKAEGFTVNGTAAATEQTICSRTTTGAATQAGAQTVTISCNFSDNVVTLGQSQTGVITVYATGNDLGSIGLGTTPAADFLTPSVAYTTSASTSGIVFKGAQSQTLLGATAAASVTGRVVTPAGAQLRVVNMSLPSTTQPGASKVTLAKRNVIVGGSNVILNQLGGNCVTSTPASVCRVGTDTIDLALDNTVIASSTALTAGTPVTYLHTGLTNILTVGTHNLESRLDDPACSTNMTVQLTTNQLGFTIGGQTFTNGGAGAFPVTIVADFNTYGGNNMTHPSNLCG